jgi:hypothetical protein
MKIDVEQKRDHFSSFRHSEMTGTRYCTVSYSGARGIFALQRAKGQRLKKGLLALPL